MPIVVSLLNSLSGVATSATGFSLKNSMLIMTGAMVTSSGALLSNMMCKGINRSIWSVLSGGFGVEDGNIVETGNGVAREVHTVTADQLVQKLVRAKRVLVVPGYGMAVARCQQLVAEISRKLRSEFGVDLVFAIHPVAGRLPGHMNVLLAEAEVPYDVVQVREEARVF